MSSTIFFKRLQSLKDIKKYPEKVISQFEKVAYDNNGKLPKKFFLYDIGYHTISSILRDLTFTQFDIYAPNGSKSSCRKIILY